MDHRFRWRRDAEAIAHVLAGLPDPIRARLARVRYVSGYDPAFLGLHHERTATDGRAYASTSHCAWPHNLLHRPASDRPTTIVLQGTDARDPEILLHELGHALDAALGWYREPVVPLDSYAARNRREAFATAFQSWATTNRGGGWRFFHDRGFLLGHDPRTAAFLDRLASDHPV